MSMMRTYYAEITAFLFDKIDLLGYFLCPDAIRIIDPEAVYCEGPGVYISHVTRGHFLRERVGTEYPHLLNAWERRSHTSREK